jgi:hypothetical protein
MDGKPRFYCRHRGGRALQARHRAALMPLTMRPTGLSSPVDTIYSGDWAIDRIYEQRGGPDFMHWLWSLHGIFGHVSRVYFSVPDNYLGPNDPRAVFPLRLGGCSP